MNNVISFGFILKNEQMKELLLKIYKNTDEKMINDERWISILDYNKENVYIFCKKIIQDYPNIKNMNIYYDSCSYGDVLFSIKTIFDSCDEGLEGTEYIKVINR